MKIKGEMKVTVSAGMLNMFESAKIELKKRGKDVLFKDFSLFLESKLKDKWIEEYVDINTPVEFKLKEAVNDPLKKDAIIQLLKKLEKSNSFKTEEENSPNIYV